MAPCVFPSAGEKQWFSQLFSSSAGRANLHLNSASDNRQTVKNVSHCSIKLNTSDMSLDPPKVGKSMQIGGFENCTGALDT